MQDESFLGRYGAELDAWLSQSINVLIMKHKHMEADGHNNHICDVKATSAFYKTPRHYLPVRLVLADVLRVPCQKNTFLFISFPVFILSFSFPARGCCSSHTSVNDLMII